MYNRSIITAPSTLDVSDVDVPDVSETSDAPDTLAVSDTSDSATIKPELPKHEQASSMLGSFDFVKAPEPESQPTEPDEPPTPTVAAAEAPESEATNWCTHVECQKHHP